jgi:hypothetical protein
MSKLKKWRSTYLTGKVLYVFRGTKPSEVVTND